MSSTLRLTPNEIKNYIELEHVLSINDWLNFKRTNMSIGRQMRKWFKFNERLSLQDKIEIIKIAKNHSLGDTLKEWNDAFFKAFFSFYTDKTVGLVGWRSHHE